MARGESATPIGGGETVKGLERCSVLAALAAANPDGFSPRVPDTKTRFAGSRRLGAPNVEQHESAEAISIESGNGFEWDISTRAPQLFRVTRREASSAS